MEFHNGSQEQQGRTVPDLLTGPLKVMLDKWSRDILKQVPLWHKVMDFLLKGTLSEALLAECRNKLQDFEETKKGKASRIDWEDFRKVGKRIREKGRQENVRKNGEGW